MLDLCGASWSWSIRKFLSNENHGSMISVWFSVKTQQLKPYYLRVVKHIH